MVNKLLTVLAFAVLTGKSVTQNIGTCTVDDGGAINWSLGYFNNEAIKDTEGLELKFPFTGNLEVETSNNGDDGKPYIDVTIEGSDLVFRTNAYFLSDFEKDQRSHETQNSLTIARSVTLKCDDAQTFITFTQPILDTNNNKPTFKSTSYTYSLPSPLVPKLDQSSVGDAITVEDLDFSNSDITFNVDPPGTFTIDTVSTEDKRTYRGILKVTKYTTLSSQTTLTVTATDNGSPASTSEPITITIDVDTENSIANPPTFSEAVYRFNYSTESGTPTVTSSDGKDIVITSTNPGSIAVEVDNPDFTATYDSPSATVTIEYTGTGLEMTTDSVLVVTLTATLNDNDADSSKTAILVDIPSDLVVTKPTFDRAYYTATYDSSTSPHTVTLDQDITVTENATVSLENESGDSDANFNIQYTDSKWRLKVKVDLDEEELEAGGEKILTLHATVTQDTETYNGYATLVVKLPKVIEIDSPKFTSLLYTATYDTVDGTGYVTLSDEITATSIGQTVTISIKDPSVYFDIVKSGDKWTVIVLENLPHKDIIAGTEYVMILEATIPYQVDVEPGYSTLIITPTPVLVPTFAKNYYTATYQVDNDVATVEVSNGPIEISLLSNQTDENVALEGDYYQNFDIEFDTANNSFHVNVASELDQDVLRQGDDIILTIWTTTEYSTASTLLIITLPKIASLEALKFSRAYYTAWYMVRDDSAAITLSSEISVTSSQDQEVTVDFEEANENFSLVKVAHNTWVIAIEENLSDDDLEEHDLFFSLEATARGSDVEKSTLIVHLPSNCTNVF